MVDRGSEERPNGTDDETSADSRDQDGGTADRSTEPDPPAPDRATTAAHEDDAVERRSDVIVPLAIYKRVTVVSTVVASVLVVVGFLLLDAATKQTRLLRAPIERVLEWVGLGISAGSLSVLLGIAGLAVIVAGAAIYVFGARFRTAGMGSDKTDGGETNDNG